MKDPVVQKQRWLNSVNDVMTKLKGKEADARQAVKIPHGMSTTHAETFKSVHDKLVDIRAWLGSPTDRSQHQLRCKLIAADKTVKGVKQDITAFDSAYRTYHKDKTSK